MPEWVAARVAEVISTPPRDRRRSFSASSSGDCLRAQEFAFLGTPPSQEQRTEAQMAAIFDDGKWRHIRWQARLLASGILDGIEVPMAWPKMNARGSLDGEGLVPDDHPNRLWRGKDFGFELKGVNPFQYPRWVKAAQPQEGHLWQVHRYFVVTGKELFVIIYENKGTNQWHEWVIRPIAKMMRASERELRALNQSLQMQRLHAPLSTCRIGVGPHWKECAYGGKGGTCMTTRGWPSNSAS